MFGQLRKMKMGMNWSKIELFKNNFEKKNQVFLSFILKLTMEITVPSCGIPHPRKTEFFAGWEMLDALVPKIRFHEQAYQSGRESSHCVTYSYQSQGELSFLGLGIPRDSMGRVKDNHTRKEPKSGTEGNHYPDIRDKMVPRFEQEKHQVWHLKCCQNPRPIALQEVSSFRG